jgi:peptidoglycan/LPS O-acetylase OafA/YrhL
LVAKTSDNFTLLRLALALLVVFSHSYPLSGRAEPMLFHVTAGTFAVQGFFAISGYLIAGSYLMTQHPGLFVWKRIMRIMPALAFAVPLSLLLWALQDRYAGNPIPGLPNGSLWTISWESLMYVLTLLFGLVGLLTAPVLGSAVVAGAVLFFLKLPAASPNELIVPPLFVLFAAGAMIRLSEHQFDLAQCGALACGAMLFVFLPGIAGLYGLARGDMFFAFGPGLPWEDMRRFICILALPFAVLFVCRRFPFSLPLRSDYSYGIYVWAWPVQETLVHQAMRHEIPLGPRTLFIASTLVSAGCAFVSWHLIEKNALRLSHLNAGALKKAFSIAFARPTGFRFGTTPAVAVITTPAPDIAAVAKIVPQHAGRGPP